MVDNNYLIDWLSFTIQTDINGIGKSAVKGFLEKMGLDNLPFLEKETGRHGYNRSLTIQNYINVYYNEVKFNQFDKENTGKLDRIISMGVHFEFSGKGCRILEKEKNCNVIGTDIKNSAIEGALRNKKKYNANVKFFVADGLSKLTSDINTVLIKWKKK